MFDSVQICFRIPKKILQKLEKIRDLTGLPISDQIKIVLAGYRIQKISNNEIIL